MMRFWDRYRRERVRGCPLCGASAFRPYLKIRRHLLRIYLEKCADCGLVIQNPRLTDGALADFYNRRYRAAGAPSDSRMDELFERGRRRGAYICEFFDNNGIEYRNSEVSEVGCGYGGILEEFRRRGSKVRGCDIEPVAVRYASSKGLDVVRGDAGALVDPRRKSDFVILSHVLEHVADSAFLFECAHRILKDAGVIYVEAPGIMSLKGNPKRYAQLSHLMYFELRTMRAMAQKANFEFIAGNEIVQAVFRKKTNDKR